MGIMGIMGLLPEIPIIPAFPEIPENSPPKKATPFNNINLPKPHHPNFLREGVRCGLDKEIAPDRTYLAYFLFGAMIERSQMTPYHKKFLLGVRYRASLSNHRNLHLTWIGHLVLNLLCYIV